MKENIDSVFEEYVTCCCVYFFVDFIMLYL